MRLNLSILKRSLMTSSGSAASPPSLPSCSSSSASSSATYTPANYKAQRNEMGVFTTPPYSTAIKAFWRYKDKEVAEKSAKEIWQIFERYKEMKDFVGMDIARKFIMMGRTRSLRYALRKGGKKYFAAGEGPDVKGKEEEGDDNSKATYQVKRATGERLQVIPRTGKVYDQGKLDGAEVFRSFENRCWSDGVYMELWDKWKVQEGKPKGASKGSTGSASRTAGPRGVKREREDEDHEKNEGPKKEEEEEEDGERGKEQATRRRSKRAR